VTTPPWHPRGGPMMQMIPAYRNRFINAGLGPGRALASPWRSIYGTGCPAVSWCSGSPSRSSPPTCAGCARRDSCAPAAKRSGSITPSSRTPGGRSSPPYATATSYRLSPGSRLRGERQLRHQDPQLRPRRQRAERSERVRKLLRETARRRDGETARRRDGYQLSALGCWLSAVGFRSILVLADLPTCPHTDFG
jgi:hypothetical protein